MSIRQENRKKNIRALFVTVAAVVVLAAVGLAIVAAQNGSVFDGRGEGYYYSSSDEAVYSKVGNGFAVASKSELQIFGSDGVMNVQETYIMSSPAISSGGSNAVLYDIGGNSVKIFNSEKIIKSMKMDNTVISASVGDGGYTAVCCEEIGYQGAVYVYNSGGSLTFKWLSGGGYVLSACVSADNSYLAAITIGDYGTRIVKLKLNEESYKKEYTVADEILLDAAFNEEGEIFAISNEKLYISDNNELKELYSFEEMNIIDYNLGKNAFIALSNHKTGGACKVICVTSKGVISEAASFENGIISIDVGKKYMAVLTDTDLYVYNVKSFKLTAEYEISVCLKVLVYEDGAIVAASKHMAEVYKAKSSNR